MTSFVHGVLYAAWIIIIALGWIVISGGDASPETWIGTTLLSVWLVAHVIVRSAEDE
jgi:cytochrome b561